MKIKDRELMKSISSQKLIQATSCRPDNAEKTDTLKNTGSPTSSETDLQNSSKSSIVFDYKRLLHHNTSPYRVSKKSTASSECAKTKKATKVIFFIGIFLLILLLVAIVSHSVYLEKRLRDVEHQMNNLNKELTIKSEHIHSQHKLSHQKSLETSRLERRDITEEQVTSPQSTSLNPSTPSVQRPTTEANHSVTNHLSSRNHDLLQKTDKIDYADNNNIDDDNYSDSGDDNDDNKDDEDSGDMIGWSDLYEFIDDDSSDDIDFAGSGIRADLNQTSLDLGKAGPLSTRAKRQVAVHKSFAEKGGDEGKSNKRSGKGSTPDSNKQEIQPTIKQPVQEDGKRRKGKRQEREKQHVKIALPIIHMEAYGTSPRERIPPSEVQMGFRFWNVSSWVKKNSIKRFYHFDQSSGHVTVEEKGAYLIYVQVLYHDAIGRWSVGVFVNDAIRLKCLETEQLKEIKDYHPTSHGVYKQCSITSVIYVSKKQTVSIRCMYGHRTILTQPEFTFWGLVKLE